MLDVDYNFMEEYYKNKSNYISFFFHRYFLMTNTITSMLKQSLVWEQCKVNLEQHFNKDMQELVI
jgi:hypothetical protein